MKILLRIFVLGLFIVIQSQSNICAMNDGSPEEQDSSKWEYDSAHEICYYSDGHGHYDFWPIPGPGVCYVLHYELFTDGDKKRIRINKHRIVPDQRGIAYGFKVTNITAIGEWDADDPYVKQTFEFIDDHQCHYR